MGHGEGIRLPLLVVTVEIEKRQFKKKQPLRAAFLCATAQIILQLLRKSKDQRVIPSS